MKLTIAKYLSQKVYILSNRPFVPDFVLAHAFDISLEESSHFANYYRRISQPEFELTYRLPKKLFQQLVATCVSDSKKLFGSYSPILCSPLIVLLIANKVKNGTTDELRNISKAKGLKQSLVYLYDESIIKELQQHQNFRIRFLGHLLHQCLPYCKNLPKEYLVFKV